MKKFTKAQLKKSIKETRARYSFLSIADIVHRLNKLYPDNFQEIANAEIEVIMEDMGL